MLVTVIVTLCLQNGSCIERTVTNEATLMQCGGAFGAQAIPQWMQEHGYTARGYSLAKWGCVIGGRKRERA